MALPNFNQAMASFDPDSDNHTVGPRWKKWASRFENYLVAMNVTSLHVKFPGFAGRLPEMGTISRSPDREQDSPGFVLERCYFFHDAFIRVNCEIILDNFVGHVLRHRSRWDRRILIGRYS